MELSNLEVHWLVKELKELEGSHFVKFSKVDGFYKLRVRNGGTKDIIIKPPECIFMTRYSYKAAEPDALSMKIRKELKGTRILEIRNPNFDRVVEFLFSNGDRLVIELFSHGNIILVSKEGNTLVAKEYREWKDREIKQGREYSYPRSMGLDPTKMEFEDFVRVFTGPDLIRSLIRGIKLGNKYLEYACVKAGERMEDKQPKDAKALFKLIKDICNRYEPGLSKSHGPLIFPISDADFIRKGSFNEALDDFYSNTITKHETGTESEREKLLIRLKQQEERLASLKREAKEYKMIGDLIYQNYERINTTIEAIHKMRKRGMDWETIEERLRVKIDPRRGVFWIDLGT